jgi:hypothetical protein
VNEAVIGNVQTADPLRLLSEVAWRELPLCWLLRLIREMSKELLVSARAEAVTEVHHAKATMLRLALVEVLERAGRITRSVRETGASSVKPLVCACGDVFEAIDEMDEHLWEAFVPASDIGLDGKMHAELNRTWLLARLANDDGDDEDEEKMHA